jgi:uncharacterized protein YkwD
VGALSGAAAFSAGPCPAAGAGTPAARPAQDRTVDLGAVPSAREYSTDVPKGPGFLGSEAAVLNRGLARINAALGTELRPDNRLARVARWVYENLGPDRALPSQSAMDVLTHRLGLPEPTVHLLVTGAPDAPRAANVVSSRLARLFDVRAYTHIGGVAERERGGVVAVVALSRRPVSLRPVARQLASPGNIWFAGRLASPYSRPELAHTLPDGRTSTHALGEGREFGLFVGLEPKGRHRLEIVAQGPDGPTVLVNFPVFVGVPVESTASAAGAPRGKTVRSDEVRDILFERVNADRVAAGLEPLAADPELDEVALSHSEDMRDNGFVAHVSPRAGATEERLARAGIVTPLAAENVAKGYSAEEIHRGFMDSPGHRGAALLADATHVGIGVASKKEGDLTTYYATEIFVRRIPTLPADAKSLFLEELNGLRRSAGLGRLAEDFNLTRMAETAARDFLVDASLSQSDAAHQLVKRLAETSQRQTSLEVVLSLVGSLEDGAKQAASDTRLDRARRIGIGLAQGSRPGQPPNTIVLVLIFSE